MKNEIWFDMDGTLVDFYNVKGWLDYLNNENTTPYEIAKPLINMQVLARVLNRLIANGYEINIISWASKNASNGYIERIATAKKVWLAKHLKSVKFTKIDIVAYGTPKNENRNGILFDDELKNRTMWNGIAYNVENIIEILKELN